MTNNSSKEKFNQFFISKQKRRGLYLLLFLLVLIAFLPRIFLILNKQDQNVQIEKTNELSEFESSKEEHRDKLKQKRKKPNSKYHPLKNRKILDNISVEEWIELGLSVKQAKVVFSIVQKGIKNQKELIEIKYLPKELFYLIKDSIQFNNQTSREDKSAFEQEIRNQRHIKINICDYEDLIETPGIGSYTANSILKFRKALGGFYKKEQLLEVYNMRLENYIKMKESFVVDTLNIIKININTCDFKELVSHPYISSNQANSILKMRAQKNNKYEKLEEILESVLIDEETFNKLHYYITLK